MIRYLHNKITWLTICVLTYNTMIPKTIIHTRIHTHISLFVSDIFIIKLYIMLLVLFIKDNKTTYKNSLSSMVMIIYNLIEVLFYWNRENETLRRKESELDCGERLCQFCWILEFIRKLNFLGSWISHLLEGGVGGALKMTDLLKFCLEFGQGSKQVICLPFIICKMETLLAPTSLVVIRIKWNGKMKHLVQGLAHMKCIKITCY